jgi:hypothetical protein
MNATAAMLIVVALKALQQIALLTKTTKDDQVVEIANRMIDVLLQGKMPVWTAIFWALDIAKFFAARSARTGDDKLVKEFSDVAAAIERVAGKDVYRPQYADPELVIDWPFLAAPGVPGNGS